jgi:BirA family biotin operon repressor/biotin-[acetyl-CoA-carboxylase] ligase
MIFRIKEVEKTLSTNADLKRAAALGEKEGSVLVARRQSGGRGRLDRSFSSEEGGLYMSLLIELDPPMSAGLVTTYAAVAAAEALQRLSGLEVGIKWVNDLVVDGKKICGILAESLVVDGKFKVILGIGMNLTNTLPDELCHIATTVLSECGKAIEPMEMAKAILEGFTGFKEADMGEMLDKYRHRCVIIGKKITVIPHSGEKYEAEALGVLDDGSLLVKRLCDGEEICVFGGEVSTRLSEGKNES